LKEGTLKYLRQENVHLLILGQRVPIDCRGAIASILYMEELKFTNRKDKAKIQLY
jgi:hypothetical protein